MTAQGTERLQKFLAAAGIASRRKAEELILAGRVKVNQAKVTQLGTKIDPARDLVTVDGKLVSRPDASAYYLLYKPPGCVTTASDPEGRPTALEYLRGVRERVFPVGRLDYDAEGALLLTNDGELANRLAHPRYGHRRVYLVKVRGDPAPEALARMTAGVRLEDGPAQALEASIHERAEKNVWIRVVVGEGRFHLVKRLCEAVGLQVQRLFRPEFAGITVERLRPGKFRPLAPAEIRAMKESVALAPGETPARMPGRDLPRAARRHGHGPPAPPQGRASEEGRTSSTEGSALRPRAPSGDAPLRVRGEDEKRGEGKAQRKQAWQQRPRPTPSVKRSRGEASAERRGGYPHPPPSPPPSGGEGRGEGGRRATATHRLSEQPRGGPRPGGPRGGGRRPR